MNRIEFEFDGECREETGSKLFPDGVSVSSTTCELGLSRDVGEAKSLISIGESDILEVETEDGAWLLTRQQFFALSNLDDEGYVLDSVGKRQQSDTTKRSLPTTVNMQRGKRGFVSWVLKALRVLKIDLAGFLVDKLSKKIDASLVFNDQPGLYRLGRDGAMHREPMQSGADPVLLLVHGTASSTLGAFRELLPNKETSEFQKQPWQSIHDAFGGRVFAFEHATLSVPVAKNTLDLLESLPQADCPPLVLMSHSRGGLVTDLLASLRQSVVEGSQSLDLLPSNSKSVDKEDLEELAYLGKLAHCARARSHSGLPLVIRHVRVACPAAGTSLAGPNTNIYLSIIAKLLDKIPNLPVLGFVIDIVEALFELAAAVVKEGLEPGALPGIESMKPDGLLVDYLQSIQNTSGELVVVSGDSSGFVDKILWPIFIGPHDYVVDTVSMVDGFKYLSYDEYPLVGDGVSHTQYFGRSDVQGWLMEELQPTVNRTRVEAQQRVYSSRGRVANKDILDSLDQTCLVFLPGFMGSELSSKGFFGDYDIWVDYLRLIFGKGDDLELDNSDVFVSGVLQDVYEDFIQHANQKLHVVPFAYDWRGTIEAPIDELERLISSRLDDSLMPITLVCHSMGGLVARAWRDRYPNTWKRVVQRGGYMIQGGTPNLGTWQVPMIFSGEHDLLNKLSRYDVENSKRDWQRMIAKFPGPVQMAVYDKSLLGDSAIDLSKKEGWEALGGGSTLPKVTLLEEAAAAAAKRKLDKFESDDHIIYIAGSAKATPKLSKENGKWCLVDSNEGDGLALWRSAGKDPDYYINAAHGNIFNLSEAFDSILDLSLNGSTSGLSKTRPSAASRGFEAGGSERRVREGLGLDATYGPVSTKAQLLSAITHGGSVQNNRQSRQASTRLEVEVIHGNLMFCEAPVLVGHYQGDRIIRAEAALDRHFRGVLSQRWKLGEAHYASEPGDSEVVLAREAFSFGPKGAIVVGLGRMGELTQGDLILTVMCGVQSYLQAMIEAGRGSRPLSIATLLVGSGNEELKLGEVLEGILRGVTQANETFRARDGNTSAAIAKVQIIEWHFDLALEARWALERIKEQGEFEIELQQVISINEGGLRRLRRDNNDQWWTSLSIGFAPRNDELENEDLETLDFSVGGSKAMGQADKVIVSRERIDRRIKSISTDRFDASMKAQKTLFEQLIPSTFKNFAAQQRNLILELDPAVAYIPWELLVDRRSIGVKPLSVAAGMLRRIRPQDTSYDKTKLVAETRRALIVGNPPAENTDYPYLQGAVDEAQCVENIIARSPLWKSKSLIYKRGISGSNSEQEIFDESHTGDYQLLHLAAHGAYVADSESDSGVIIGEKELADGSYKPLYFYPRDVESLRLVPSLVFLNCCHTGSISKWQGLHHLSASLAAEFIKAGAKAVVAASWAINDADALRFANTFYDAMFVGTPFGESVSLARRSIYRADSSTWAAYQCYGDPGFVLPGVQSTKSSQSPRYQHEDEVVMDLKNIESELRAYKSKSSAPDSRLRHWLDRVTVAATESHPQRSPIQWVSIPKVTYALALAYGELGDWQLAEVWLRRSVDADGSQNSIEDILRVRNYLIRYSEQQADQLESEGDVGSDKYLELLELTYNVTQSLTSMEVILPGSASVHEHIASAWKLVAMMLETLSDNEIDPKSNRAALKNLPQSVDCLVLSRNSYHRAFDQKMNVGKDDSWYPGNNALLMEALVRSKSRKLSLRLAKKAFSEFKAKLKLEIERQSMAAVPDVWAMLAEQEYKLSLWVLGDEDQKDSLGDIGTGIADAIKSYGSAGQVDSVAKQLRCMIKFLSRSRKKEIVQMLARIRQEL